MSLIWIFVLVGGLIGGYLPSLFGQGSFSLWSILLSAFGSIIGIWLYKRFFLD